MISSGFTHVTACIRISFLPSFLPFIFERKSEHANPHMSGGEGQRKERSGLLAEQGAQCWA